MREFEIELEVGQALQIGDYSITLLDIENSLAVIRVDDESESESSFEPTREFTGI